jgi:WD40 repeat protein
MSAGRGALLAEIATGRIVLRTDEETAAGFSADGSRAAVQGPDGEHLIETASGARLAALDAGDGSADDLIRIDYVFSPDGRRLVTLGNAASLLDAGSGRRVASIGETFVETASVDRAGGRVAITYDDGVSVWDAAGRALAHRLDGSRLAVFTPDGARLVTATYWDDGEHTTIRDPATLQIERDISGTVGAAERVFFAPDGSRLAVTGQGKVDVWATADWTLEQSLDGAVVDVSFASGRLLVARRADQTEVRDLDSGGVLAVIPGAAAAISRDGTRVATWYDTIDASRSDQLVIWDLGPARWRTLASTQLLQPLHDGTIAIERAVSCCQATVWDVAAGARSRQLDHLAGIADDGRSFGAWVDGALELRDAHDQLLARLAIAPPEGRVVTGGGWVVVVRSDGLELWSLAAGARVSSLSGSWRELALEAAAPLGVRADRDRVEVAELATGVVIARFDVADVADVAISPDGSYLVIAARRGDEDVAVSVLDVKTGGQLTSFEQGNDELRLDPTGRRLLVGGLLRDLRTGALIAVLEEGASARYAPAGDRIVGGDSMTTIRDGATGLVLAAEPGFRGGSSGDGAWLAVGARVLDQRPEAAPPDEVAAFARCRAPFQIEGGRLVPADLDLAACIQP